MERLKLQDASLRPENGGFILLLQFGGNKFINLPISKGMDLADVWYEFDKVAREVSELIRQEDIKLYGVDGNGKDT